jgi:hypothetical protein
MRIDGRFTEYASYAFSTHLSLSEILERVNEVSGRQWSMADSDELGLYLASGIYDEPHRGRNSLRIFMEGDEFVIDALYRSSVPTAEQEWEALHTLVRDEILRLVEARNVHGAKDYSS